jgi:hypothetical protein
MILIHIPSKLSIILCMKGITYLMVMMAYHLPYTELTGCDELGLSEVERKYEVGCWVVICGHDDHRHV